MSLCPECGRVAYCGRACSTAALQEWHGSECLDASSCTPLEPALSGISPTCMVALRAYKRARRQGGPLPKRTDSGKGGADVAVTVTETQGACHDRFGSVASSPPRGGGDDVAWPNVKLGNLQEHYAARSARERDLLETEAAVTAVLASGFGSGTGLDADSLGSSGSGRACELVAAELATTLVKVGGGRVHSAVMGASSLSFGLRGDKSSSFMFCIITRCTSTRAQYCDTASPASSSRGLLLPASCAPSLTLVSVPLPREALLQLMLRFLCSVFLPSRTCFGSAAKCIFDLTRADALL